MAILPKLNLIELKNVPIFEQLQLEEKLLRTSDESYCIINRGSPPAIVMGISGKPEELLDLKSVKAKNIPVIKRFSGGGTVIVDENTLFITFICGKSFVNVPPFPEPILRWTEQIYNKAWQIPNFLLRENDFCIGNQKCGGNAQYIKRDRWLHHTSFLWDYSEKNMEYLLLPAKRPKYRLDRSHSAFLTRLKEHATLDTLIENFKSFIANVKPLYISDLQTHEAPHRKSTQLVEL